MPNPMDDSHELNGAPLEVAVAQLRQQIKDRGEAMPPGSTYTIGDLADPNQYPVLNIGNCVKYTPRPLNPDRYAFVKRVTKEYREKIKAMDARATQEFRKAIGDIKEDAE